MNWQTICDHPSLQDLPFKIETDRWGDLVMSPATNWHGMYQSEIAFMLRSAKPQGRTITEASIQTTLGVKVPDVVWCSVDFIARHEDEFPFSVAPEICIEVVSASNSPLQMQEKMALYFASGAHECWLCTDGDLQFFNADGSLAASLLVPDFPQQIRFPPRKAD